MVPQLKRPGTRQHWRHIAAADTAGTADGAAQRRRRGGAGAAAQSGATGTGRHGRVSTGNITVLLCFIRDVGWSGPGSMSLVI